MKHLLVKIIYYFFLALNVFVQTNEHTYLNQNTYSSSMIKHNLQCLTNENFQLQQIKGASHLLGIKKCKKEYSLAIVSDGKKHYETSEKDKINLYSGGSHMFIWRQDKKFINTITQFDITNNEIIEKRLSSKYTIFDIIQYNDEQFMYALDKIKEMEVLINLRRGKRYEFIEKSYGSALNDTFVQYRTQSFMLTEALPDFTPSLLCYDKFVLGYFFTKNATASIATSHDGKRYVLRNNQRFLHYDYKSERQKMLTLDEQLWQNSHVQCMDFAGTNDVVILCFLHHLLIIDFYEDKKYWVVQSDKELFNTFPLPQHEKTIILTQDNTFAELTYDHTKDAFALTYE